MAGPKQLLAAGNLNPVSVSGSEDSASGSDLNAGRGKGAAITSESDASTSSTSSTELDGKDPFELYYVLQDMDENINFPAMTSIYDANGKQVFKAIYEYHPKEYYLPGNHSVYRKVLLQIGILDNNRNPVLLAKNDNEDFSASYYSKFSFSIGYDFAAVSLLKRAAGRTDKYLLQNPKFEYDLMPTCCQCCSCSWCCYSSFKIKNVKSGNMVGKMHTKWAECPGVFGISFAKDMPREEKASLLVSGLLLNSLHFTTNEYFSFEIPWRIGKVGFRRIYYWAVNLSLILFIATLIFLQLYNLLVISHK